MTAPDLDDIAAARLRAMTQRYTRGRRALVGVLARSDQPMTISQILEADDALAQSSAYRNLALLEQAGVVHRIVTSDDFAHYELAEDLTEHHHHLICTTCGTVQDFTLTPAAEGQLDRSLRRVARSHAFDAGHHRLDLIGTCERCT